MSVGEVIMDVNSAAKGLKAKGWSVSIPGQFTRFEFDLVAVLSIRLITMRHIHLLVKCLRLLDVKDALVWQTNYEVMLSTAKPGLIKASGQPPFILCLAAEEISADAHLLIRTNSNLLGMLYKPSNYGNAFIIDEEHNIAYGHDAVLKSASNLRGILW